MGIFHLYTPATNSESHKSNFCVLASELCSDWLLYQTRWILRIDWLIWFVVAAAKAVKIIVVLLHTFMLEEGFPGYSLERVKHKSLLYQIKGAFFNSISFWPLLEMTSISVANIFIEFLLAQVVTEGQNSKQNVIVENAYIP